MPGKQSKKRKTSSSTSSTSTTAAAAGNSESTSSSSSARAAASGSRKKKAAKGNQSKKWVDYRNGDDDVIVQGPTFRVLPNRGQLPKRNAKGELVFADAPTFRPTLTPLEVVQGGAFGGTYFRAITKADGTEYFMDPNEKFGWQVDGNLLFRTDYDPALNRFKAKCGGSLQMWLSKGWISNLNPLGWFEWYCNFYAGQRTTGDDWQIGRWLKCAGPKGRWKNRLVNIKASGKESPVISQVMWHWALDPEKLKIEQQASKELGKKRK